MKSIDLDLFEHWKCSLIELIEGLAKDLFFSSFHSNEKRKKRERESFSDLIMFDHLEETLFYLKSNEINWCSTFIESIRWRNSRNKWDEKIELFTLEQFIEKRKRWKEITTN